MKSKIGVLGAGTMGAGIAQVTAQSGHEVVLVDVNQAQLDKAKVALVKILDRLVEKGNLHESGKNDILNRMCFSTRLEDFREADLVIEAIVEKLEAKHAVFKEIEEIVSMDCIIASNTSSLSIASIGAVLKFSSRVIGIHFFNPAPLMPLVEIIPAVQTSEETLSKAKSIIDSWKKLTVVCKDTPGFIVNRVARPFYGEALRIYEEGIADFATIDWALTELGGFRMGPFTLMDYIGNDINYTVTETVFSAFYYDPRFKPSFTQKRHMEAGFLGRKTGRGFYDYSDGAELPAPKKDEKLGREIVDRVLAMLINEAYDALFLNIASREDIDIAMTKGVNYPKGLLVWSEEIGLKTVLARLEHLFAEYGEDRYRPNPLLRRLAK
ncbi:3-hydroxyacyl-CoA dehydrogenase NAD-binding domain-containing protein [Fluviicola sp.]|jgi:3-hydroxybutyryl-CoA dehydrogenase|uniref:3-hydroxyacyl-CoA dehydrogenase NAD-binding domain-containing protein n=1 Tax=Fluviicola sp. TaxID=1917219 RepID=UPI0028275FB4|nr:3-hydroxyacyl-CoA dehydrogenase NAD-binding domain-containing protein [Fluviicola sp.]MDR0800997.1 3-hydroxybutyryl-CoA dehydrogenase [Fluviicola sp.]